MGVGEGEEREEPESKSYSHIFFVLNFVLEMPSLPITKEYSTPLTISIPKFKFTVISYKEDLHT